MEDGRGRRHCGGIGGRRGGVVHFGRTEWREVLERHTMGRAEERKEEKKGE